MSTPIERLRALHKPCAMPCFDHAWVGDRQHCAGPHCLATWPCDTVAALDALEEAYAEADRMAVDAIGLAARHGARLDALENERDSSITEPITVAHLAEIRVEFDRPRKNLGDYPSGRFSEHEFGGILTLAEKQAASLDAATVLIWQAMRDLHMSTCATPDGYERICGSRLGISIDTCPNCRPYREWLAGEE